MDITEVRIKLMDDPNDRLRAFCSVTFDGAFVVRDLKIIQGAKGSFVAMPSRKLTDRCPRCGCKNHLRACFCNQCGARLNEDRAAKDHDGRAKLYADIAHPINSECREQIQQSVLDAFEQELARSHEPGYVCTYDDFGEDSYATLHDSEVSSRNGDREAAAERRTEVAEQSSAAGHDETTETEPAEPQTIPMRQTDEDGQIRRVETATDQPTGPHTLPVRRPAEESKSFTQTAMDDDNFGAGIV